MSNGLRWRRMRWGLAVVVMGVGTVWNGGSTFAAPVLGVRAYAAAVDASGAEDATDGSHNFTWSATPVHTDAGLAITNNGFGSAFAQAEASYGTLRAYATASAGYSGNIGGGGYSDGLAMFEDTWTIDDLALNGQQGSVRLFVNVGGSLGGSFLHPGVTPGASWWVMLNQDARTARMSWDFANNTYVEDAVVYFDQNFIYGQPFTFSLLLQASAGANYQTAPVVTADYFGTATLSDVTVYDPLGQELPRFEIQAESGHDYGFVPEPATVGLLAVGALAVLVRWRTRAIPRPRAQGSTV